MLDHADTLHRCEGQFDSAISHRNPIVAGER